MGAAGGCSGAGTTAANNFLARTSGLTTTESTAMRTAICAMVADGLITGNLSGATGCGVPFDAIYVFAVTDPTAGRNSLLNLCGTSFTATAVGSPTFTTDNGYTGGAYGNTTVGLNTGFNPNTAGGNYTTNAAHLSFWSFTDSFQPAFSNDWNIGAGNTTTDQAAFIGTVNSPEGWFCILNGLTTTAGIDYQPGGTQHANVFTLCNRTTSTNVQFYLAGVLVATTTTATTDLEPNGSSVAIAILNWIIAGGGFAGGALHQIGMATFGGSLSSTQVGQIQTIWCAYFTSVRGACS